MRCRWQKHERTVKVQTGKRVSSSSRARHYPVSVVDGKTIRIEWRSPQEFVVPGVKRAIAALGRQNVTIDSLKREVVDLTGDREGERRSMDDKILHLAERGNLMAATKLARRVYKLSLTEAKQFVEEMLE